MVALLERDKIFLKTDNILLMSCYFKRPYDQYIDLQCNVNQFTTIGFSSETFCPFLAGEAMLCVRESSSRAAGS